MKDKAEQQAKKYKTRLRKRTPPKQIYDPFKEIEDLLKPHKTKKISSGTKSSKNTLFHYIFQKNLFKAKNSQEIFLKEKISFAKN